MDNEREAIEAARDWLSDNREIYVTYGPMQFAAFAFEAGSKWQARARVGKGEVDRAFDDGARFAIAMKSAKPVEPTEFEIALKAREMEKEYNEQFGSDAIRPDFIASAKLALSESSEAKPVEVGELAGVYLEHAQKSNPTAIVDVSAIQAILNKYNVTEK